MDIRKDIHPVKILLWHFAKVLLDAVDGPPGNSGKSRKLMLKWYLALPGKSKQKVS